MILDSLSAILLLDGGTSNRNRTGTPCGCGF
jgi:hypothetical protein